MSSYGGNNSQYVGGGGYNSQEEMAAQGWGKNYGQYGGTQSYADNVTNTGMGPRAFASHRGPSPPTDPLSQSQSQHQRGTTTRRGTRDSYYSDEDSYDAMRDPDNSGGRRASASYGPRRTSMESASSTRSFDDSQHLGEGVSGRGSMGYRTGMGRNMDTGRQGSYGSSTYDRAGTGSSKPGTGGWKGAMKRLAHKV